ncbi:MAG: cytochrome c oxidase subunit II [Bacteroidota bacterium]
MMSLVIGIGVVLVLAILYMIFRIGSLVSVMGGPEKPGGSANRINAALFLVFMISSLTLFFWYSFSNFDRYNLPVASEHGKVTDHLFWITMVIVVAAFAVIFAVMFWFTFKYQYKEGRKATFLTDNHMLELTWTGIPAVVMALLIFKGLNSWTEITGPAGKDAEVIELVGQQFFWTARYPGKDNTLGAYDFRLIDASNEFGLNLGEDPNTYDDFKSTELHLPKGKEILLKIRARDVLHSVFLPHFRVKMDAVPGMPTQFKFIATKTTEEMRTETGNPNFNYEMACTEVCGKGHFSMKFPVVVDEPEAFEKWKNSQEAWLKQNPEYMKFIPEKYKEVAGVKSGLKASEATASN